MLDSAASSMPAQAPNSEQEREEHEGRPVASRSATRSQEQSIDGLVANAIKLRRDIRKQGERIGELEEDLEQATDELKEKKREFEVQLSDASDKERAQELLIAKLFEQLQFTIRNGAHTELNLSSQVRQQQIHIADLESRLGTQQESIQALEEQNGSLKKQLMEVQDELKNAQPKEEPHVNQQVYTPHRSHHTPRERMQPSLSSSVHRPMPNFRDGKKR